MPDKLTKEAIDAFAIALDKLMRQAEKNLLDVVGGATGTLKEFDATVLLNSQPAMTEALRDAGYFSLAEEHVARYAEIPEAAIKAFKRRSLPTPQFTTVDAQDFRALAQMDLDQFNAIGINALDNLRLGLVRNAVSGAPFSQMVEAVRAATVGIDGKGSPLANHAYTHANTAILNFEGEALLKAGESVGAVGDDAEWEIVGVLDSKTREVCVNALANPVRTRKEWEEAGYPVSGTPGGFNCRHIFYPYFGE